VFSQNLPDSSVILTVSQNLKNYASLLPYFRSTSTDTLFLLVLERIDFPPNVAAEQEINNGSNELGQQSRKSFI